MNFSLRIGCVALGLGAQVALSQPSSSQASQVRADQPKATALSATPTVPADPELVLAGMKFPVKATVDGTALSMNGAGIRYKGPFKVYAMALYLTRRASDGEDATNLREPKRMTLKMLRDVQAEELGLLMVRGLREKVEPETGTRLSSAMLRLAEVFAQHNQLHTGDSIGIECTSKAGTRIEINGKAEPVFSEPDLCPSLMKIWLGRLPADWKLKEALLNPQG